jgi:positive regulator of sigma E activity
MFPIIKSSIQTEHITGRAVLMEISEKYNGPQSVLIYITLYALYVLCQMFICLGFKNPIRVCKAMCLNSNSKWGYSKIYLVLGTVIFRRGGRKEWYISSIALVSFGCISVKSDSCFWSQCHWLWGFCSLDRWSLLMYTALVSLLVLPFGFTNVFTHDRVTHTHTHTHTHTQTQTHTHTPCAPAIAKMCVREWK